MLVEADVPECVSDHPRCAEGGRDMDYQHMTGLMVEPNQSVSIRGFRTSCVCEELSGRGGIRLRSSLGIPGRSRDAPFAVP